MVWLGEASDVPEGKAEAMVVLGRWALVVGQSGGSGRSGGHRWHLEVVGCMVSDPGEDGGAAGVGGEDIGGWSGAVGGVGLGGAQGDLDAVALPVDADVGAVLAELMHKVPHEARLCSTCPGLPWRELGVHVHPEGTHACIRSMIGAPVQQITASAHEGCGIGVGRESGLHELGMALLTVPQPHRAWLPHGQQVHGICVEAGADGVADELHGICRGPGHPLATHTENQLVGVGILVGAVQELLVVCSWRGRGRSRYR